MNRAEPQVITVKELLKNDSLTIPDYQRPYKWTEKNVNQLIDDIVLHKEKSAYRIGTLLIHEENNATLNIVDGQQRSLTLALIAYAITKNCERELEKIYKGDDQLLTFIPKLINISFTNNTSKANIQKNYKVIERRMSEFDPKTIHFFYEKCELVKVTLYDVSEAFQFFDSQNSRGKDLEPHDLLKAFHLREMSTYSTEVDRIKTVEHWESINSDTLSKLFSQYLYRIKNWSKSRSARYFTKNDIDIFKGVSSSINEEFPFAKGLRIVHHYTDSYNDSYHRHIDNQRLIYPFQIDQTIINGKRFFEMVAYYEKLIRELKGNKDLRIINLIKNYEGNYRTGDKYIRNLFYCALIYYVDKFGDVDLDKASNMIFIWAYTLRLKLRNVGLPSIDNYALNNGDYSLVQIFNILREAILPNEITNIRLEILTENKSTKTDEIVEEFKQMKYYE